MTADSSSRLFWSAYFAGELVSNGAFFISDSFLARPLPRLHLSHGHNPPHSTPLHPTPPRQHHQVKKLQESQERTQAALKRKMEEHSIAMRKVLYGSIFSCFPGMVALPAAIVAFLGLDGGALKTTENGDHALCSSSRSASIPWSEFLGA